MSLRSSLRLPKEHGAWAMLYVPFVAGALTAGSFPPRLLLLLLSVTLVFISRESLVAWWRARDRERDASEPRRFALIYMGLASFVGLPLVVVSRLFGLIPLGVCVLALLLFNAKQSTRSGDRTVGAETLAIAGLTLTGPAAFYVAGGAWSWTAAWLWALSVAYFVSSIFYVKARVKALNIRRADETRASIRACAIYHVLLTVGLLVLVTTPSFGLLLLLAFVPVLARSFWFVARPVAQVNLKRVGVLEIVNSTVFLVLVSFALRGE